MPTLFFLWCRANIASFVNCAFFGLWGCRSGLQHLQASFLFAQKCTKIGTLNYLPLFLASAICANLYTTRFLHLCRYLQRFLCGVHRVCQCWQNVSLWCATCRPGPNLVFDKVSLYLLTLSFFFVVAVVLRTF